MHGNLRADCQAIYFTNANHWLYLEVPDAFNNVVTQFVQHSAVTTFPEGVTDEHHSAS